MTNDSGNIRLTVREVSASKALEDYGSHLKQANLRLSQLENSPRLSVPGTDTLNYLKVSDKELTLQEAEKIAKLALESKEVDKKELFSTLVNSLSFTHQRFSDHTSRTANNQNLELSNQKEQFLMGEIARKETLINTFENEQGKPSKALIESFSKEILSQSRVKDYSEKYRKELLTKALAFKHTCEQCIKYLKVLENEPVKQFRSKDGKMWLCTAEHLRDLALFKQHQKSKSIGNSLER